MGMPSDEIVRAVLNGAPNGCSCDFCTGKKRHEDWCARCANVRLRPDQHWENLDVCYECEAAVKAEVAQEVGQ